MSPILVRPVREQLEHDRIVRLLQAKAKRRFDAAANPGNEQNAPVKVGTGALYPDVLLFSLDRGHRLQAIIEVETGESVNHLEALSQWVPLSRLRVDFHLYVPANMVDVARRLAEDNHATVNEVWSYHLVGDQFRFTLMHRARETPAAARAARKQAADAASKRPAPKSAPRPPASAASTGRKAAPLAAKAGRAAKPPVRAAGKSPSKTPARTAVKPARKASGKHPQKRR